MKKILLIAYYFPPSKSVGAKRTISLYNTFIDAGYDVDVLSNNWKGDKIPGIRYIGSQEGMQVPKNTNQKKLINIDPYFRSIDRSIFSSFFKILFLEYLKKNKTQKKYDIIIASYRPSCAIMLGILLSRKYKAKLFLDLRDLISNMGHKEKIKIVDWLDKMIDKTMVRFADKVITVTPTCKLKAEKLYNRHVELIMNGIDSKVNSVNFNQGKISNDIIIFYSGSIGNTRKLDRICSFIKSYDKNSRIRLVVASGTNPMLFGGDPNIVEWVGYLSHSEVMDWQNRANYLLLLEGRTEAAIENVPAKLFEYLSARKPILADCHPDSDSVLILTETRSGRSIDTFNAFVETIETSWFDINVDLNKYTREYQNNKYLELINEEISYGVMV